MNTINNVDFDLSSKMAEIAYKEKVQFIQKQKTYRFLIATLGILLICAMICGTVIAVNTIQEQQYTINSQFAQMNQLLSGAVVTETGDNGVIVQGNDGTTTVTGGDITTDGESD